MSINKLVNKVLLFFLKIKNVKYYKLKMCAAGLPVFVCKAQNIHTEFEACFDIHFCIIQFFGDCVKLLFSKEEVCLLPQDAHHIKRTAHVVTTKLSL
jgi:hypothetical protein